jgi:ribonuclease D
MIRKRFMVMVNDQYFTTIDEGYLRSLPVGSFSGKITIVDHLKDIEEARESLIRARILGFDTETRPTFIKGRYHNVALLQLAAQDTVFLFRLNKMPIPAFIIRIFENPDITKVGVALRDDLNGLQKLRPFNPEGFVDLQQFVKQFGIEDNGLKKLVGNILGFRISKRFQTSNWEQDPLSTEQISYAATDAWVCLKIFQTLLNHR